MRKPNAHNIKYFYLPIAFVYICIAFFLYVISQIVQGNLSITSAAAHTHAKYIEIQSNNVIDHNTNNIADATDIVRAARAYIDTVPIYKSEYYEGGWPTDGRGVCTDLVAAGLLGAGYDLKDLVDADIAKDPSAYSITYPDPNIDYRRVDNLLIYFERTQVSLPTDVSNPDDLATFQPGDIVVFPEHIALVSDLRSNSGKPYLLHHLGPWQLQYEEDYLSVNQTILGHFRMRG